MNGPIENYEQLANEQEAYQKSLVKDRIALYRKSLAIILWDHRGWILDDDDDVAKLDRAECLFLDNADELIEWIIELEERIR